MKVLIAMPAGDYWLGDPCYAIPNKKWGAFVNKLFAAADGSCGNFADGVVAFGTQWGDGTYKDQHGREFPVDAGLIGLVPIEKSIKKPVGMTRVSWDAPIICERHDDGTLVFGDVTIYTDAHCDEEGWSESTA